MGMQVWSKAHDWNWNALWNYAQAEANKSHDRPWQLQGVWQETPGVIISHMFFGYSILEQTKRSGINNKLAEHVEAGRFKNGNFLLLNKVNDHGPRIAKAFGAHDTSLSQCEEAPSTAITTTTTTKDL